MLMSKYPQNVTHATFESFVQSKEFAFLKLGPAYKREIEPAIIEYFNGEHPGRFAYGIFDRDSVPATIWWGKHFRKLDKVGLDEPKDGLYLFHRGDIVAWHSGERAVSRVDQGNLLLNLVQAFAERSGSREHLDTVVEHFDRTVDKLIAES